MWFDADKFLIQHDALTVMWFIIFFYHFQFAHRAFCSLCLWFLSRGAEMSLPPFNPVLRWEHSPPALHCKCPGKEPGKSSRATKPSHGWLFPLSTFLLFTQSSSCKRASTGDPQDGERAGPSGIQEVPQSQKGSGQPGSCHQRIKRANLHHTSLQLNLRGPKPWKRGTRIKAQLTA